VVILVGFIAIVYTCCVFYFVHIRYIEVHYISAIEFEFILKCRPTSSPKSISVNKKYKYDEKIEYQGLEVLTGIPSQRRYKVFLYQTVWIIRTIRTLDNNVSNLFCIKTYSAFWGYHKTSSNQILSLYTFYVRRYYGLGRLGRLSMSFILTA